MKITFKKFTSGGYDGVIIDAYVPEKRENDRNTDNWLHMKVALENDMEIPLRIKVNTFEGNLFHKLFMSTKQGKKADGVFDTDTLAGERVHFSLDVMDNGQWRVKDILPAQH